VKDHTADLMHHGSAAASDRGRVLDAFCARQRGWALRQAGRTYRHLPQDLRERAVGEAMAGLRTHAPAGADRRALDQLLADELTAALRSVHVAWCLEQSAATMPVSGGGATAPPAAPGPEQLAGFVERGLGGLERAVLQLEIGAGRDSRTVRAALRLGPRQYARHREEGLSKLRDAITGQVAGHVCEDHVHAVVLAATGDQAAADALGGGPDRCRACAREATGLRRLLHQRLALAPWPFAIKPAGLLAAKLGALGALAGGKGASAGGAGAGAAGLAAAGAGGVSSGAGVLAAVVATAAVATGGVVALKPDSAPQRAKAEHRTTATQTRTASTTAANRSAGAASVAATATPKGHRQAAAGKKPHARGKHAAGGGHTPTAGTPTPAAGGATSPDSGPGSGGQTQTRDTSGSGSGKPAGTSTPAPASAPVQQVKDTVGTTVDAAGDTVDDTVGAVGDTVAGVTQPLPPQVAQPVQDTVGALEDTTDQVTDVVTGTVGGILNPPPAP
jgi:hypothetical protein